MDRHHPDGAGAHTLGNALWHTGVLFRLTLQPAGELPERDAVRFRERVCQFDHEVEPSAALRSEPGQSRFLTQPAVPDEALDKSRRGHIAAQPVKPPQLIERCRHRLHPALMTVGRLRSGAAPVREPASRLLPLQQVCVRAGKRRRPQRRQHRNLVSGVVYRGETRVQVPHILGGKKRRLAVEDIRHIRPHQRIFQVVDSRAALHQHGNVCKRRVSPTPLAVADAKTAATGRRGYRRDLGELQLTRCVSAAVRLAAEPLHRNIAGLETAVPGVPLQLPVRRLSVRLVLRHPARKNGVDPLQDSG